MTRDLKPLFTLLKSCKTLTCFQQIHVHIIQKGLHNDICLITSFIYRFYDKFNIISNNNKKNSFDYVTSVFTSVVNRDDYLCNAFLKVYFDYSSLGKSLSVLSGFRVSGFCLSKHTFPPLIKRCCNELNCCVGFGVHGLSIKYGLDDDLYVGSSLVEFYGKFRLLGDAQKVFDEMPVRNVMSWTKLVEACVNNGDLGRARKVFDEMPERDYVSWNVLICGYVKKAEFDNAKRLLDEMPCKNLVTFTTMVDAYATLEKDCEFWSALVSDYVHKGQSDEAVACFREMLRSNTRPDELKMLKLMSGCGQFENLHLARELDSFVMKCSSFDRCRPDVVAALVEMNAKCDNMERAMYLFKNMPKRDLISYCSMIRACSINGQGTTAVQLFYDMISEGIVPDNMAFTDILTVCRRSGLVGEGCRLFDMMKNNYSIVPSADHYSCMVDLLGHSGHLLLYG